MATNLNNSHAPKILDWLAFTALLVAALAAYFLYGANAGTAIAGTLDESSAIRVEIQRYMGYEILPVRYLSLPYDLTMNTNVYLPILDTGVLLLIFVPIAVLLGFLAKRGSSTPGPSSPYEAWLLPAFVILSCFFLLVISTANGRIFDKDMGVVVPADIDQYLSNTSFQEAPAGVVAAFFYKHFHGIYQTAIEPVFIKFSGNSDAVTYPLLLLFFGLFFYLATRRFDNRPLHGRGLLFFLLPYLFFWLILSAGIVWYGLLAFPLLTAFVFCSAPAQDKLTGLPGRIGKYAFFFAVAAYLVMGFAHRISNLKLTILANDKIAGKRIFDPACVKYLTGDFTEENVYDAYYPGIGNALKNINSEDKSLIYNVGTRFNFFIRANDKRIFKDNQLDLFDQIIAKYQSKAQVTALLKASGFKYLMVDFYTPSGDQTPEQLLVERFNKFMLLFYQNPGMKLLATNRVIKETSNGAAQYKHEVFGEVQDFGSYAIFEIK